MAGMFVSGAVLALAVGASPRPMSVDEPVADVAAFYLESCDGVSAREKKACETGVAQNRARISSNVYFARVELARFYAVRGQKSVFRTLPFDAGSGRATVELNFVLSAEVMAEAPEACLALEEAGHADYWQRLDAPTTPSGVGAWQKRIDQLLARTPGPAMNVEVLFHVDRTAKVGPMGPCAIGRPLAVRLVDAESGEVLASHESPEGQGILSSRPLHPALLSNSTGDAQGGYLASVQVQIARHLPPRAGRDELVVSVRVLIDETGQVLKAEVIRSSGDERVDRLVADAIRRASPLPAPPLPLQQDLKEAGIVVELRP